MVSFSIHCWLERNDTLRSIVASSTDVGVAFHWSVSSSFFVGKRIESVGVVNVVAAETVTAIVIASAIQTFYR